jgi:hypothetical protein
MYLSTPSRPRPEISHAASGRRRSAYFSRLTGIPRLLNPPGAQWRAGRTDDLPTGSRRLTSSPPAGLAVAALRRSLAPLPKGRKSAGWEPALWRAVPSCPDRVCERGGLAIYQELTQVAGRESSRRCQTRFCSSIPLPATGTRESRRCAPPTSLSSVPRDAGTSA